MPAPILIRTATPEDLKSISILLKTEYYVHRHLDWRTPLEWLGHQPFWLIERRQRVLAALACPPDPPEIGWIRFFACTASYTPAEAWEILFDKIKDERTGLPAFDLAGLALHDWFSRVLSTHGFYHHQDIVVLAWEARSPQYQTPAQGVFIRPLLPSDLEAVQSLDELAFEPLWQISLGTLSRSYHQAAYSTIAEMDGKIVGYQISTATSYSAHLARLAVLPNRQRSGIGSALLQDLQSHFYGQRLRFISVNTQSDNYSSLALYERQGFLRSGERFPVYRLDVAH
jgi:[ribosomal protein S18]-alanine N-acetyltransferase